MAERIAKRHLRRQVEDPELRAKLTPDYSFGCKRPTFSNDYYRTFTRAHVELETTAIERITPTGMVTADGREREIDVLVLATGFDMWDANFPAISSPAGTAATSAGGGGRPGSRPTRASRCRASRTCSTSRRRTPTQACRSSPPSRRR